MKAIVYERYGPPEVLELREIAVPPVGDGDVIVRVRATSVNPLEWHTMTGDPYLVRTEAGLRRPKTGRLGVDFAGLVEAVGKDVTAFSPGDEVFGGKKGAFAEYVVVPADSAIVAKPASVSFEEAAAVPVAGVTALQALRDKGHVQRGQNVLVHGASGGVGTFAVQIAKALHAHVTAVCSTQKIELVRALGADRVVDYTQEDFTRTDERYDVVLDVAGGRTWSELRRVLAQRARVVVVGGRKRPGTVLGPFRQLIRMYGASLGSTRRVVPLLASIEREPIEALRELIADGRMRPVIDRRYELSEIRQALAYLADGHASGKIVVTVP
jgi:NADPH:quinone reductase-like Zn-dependent oxidoreductase